MSSFQSWLNKTKTGLQDQVGRFKNKDLMEAIVAGCAVVSVADGTIDSTEKQKMAGYIGRNEQLKVFNMSEVIERFNHYAGNMEFDVMVGKQESLRVIAKFKSKPEVGRVIVGVCCAIGAADGDFDEQEKAAVRDICNVLNLSPGEFGL
ncbi:tellurite resistance TerB family protein [Saccharibacillus sp. CPCC 101409]|uniref:tellurite resistance TerB family protein n=1 Tax=Saccharibacillus sp. CPCC 101409 TaxID=3058041 RepID=UPI002673FE05|nr:tellurite resistance TerB family protein [Saccharibacillus sp. CPCC 101409]MDO3408517.1 tellurite resistance TerB family protein [Saccharibacillus sp. CPCC 101409]